MTENASSSANAVVTAGFAAGGFQLKGTTKRKIITISDDKPDLREAVLGIEKGVIKSVSTPQSDQAHLIIPLPPSRVDIVRAVRLTDNDREKFSNLPIIDAEDALLPKTLEQLAAEELIAEMTGCKGRSIENLHSIPVLNLSSSSRSSGARHAANNGADFDPLLKSAPLLAACLAPELIGLKDDDERFKADINTRPDDMGVRSDAYKVVRIEDFGAAMLRGMGWSGEVEEKREEEKIIPRDNRLGLGATSRPPEDNKKGRSKEEDKKKKKDWEKKAQEKIKKQLITEGDYVWIKDVLYAGKRGSVVAIRGVPGLDRIRICLEINGKNIEIKRTDAILLSEDELIENPYKGVLPEKIEIVNQTFFGLKPKENEVEEIKNIEKGKKENFDNENRKRNRDDSNQEKYDDKIRKTEDNYNYNERDNNKHDKTDEREKNERSSTSKKHEKMHEKNEINEKMKPSWLMTGIRVRIISKKSASYLMKGSVIDVPSKSIGTIRLDGGKIVEGIKEKYLETVLPPIGGICSVLYGQYKGQNARLIEKRKEEGLAFIQLEDDLEGVLLSMDAIASRM